MGCAIKVFKREVVEGLPSVPRQHRYLALLAKLRGARIEEIEVKDRSRHSGTSHYGMARCLTFFQDIWNIRRMAQRFLQPEPLPASTPGTHH
jgi:hypothetical protein